MTFFVGDDTRERLSIVPEELYHRLRADRKIFSRKCGTLKPDFEHGAYRRFDSSSEFHVRTGSGGHTDFFLSGERRDTFLYELCVSLLAKRKSDESTWSFNVRKERRVSLRSGKNDGV